jgi:GDP-4-dehydro-6-deoxy-D-mannose reductase
MKALITGREGFVGRYLNMELRQRGIDTISFDLKHGQDLRNAEQLRNTIDKVRPDYIYHLAAQAYVPESFTNPARAFEINTIGSLNLLEAVRQVGLNTRILLAGTSEEYGSATQNTESDLPKPKSPYAIAKLAMDYLGRWYAETYGMNVVVTRAFNHTGAGRGEQYAESSFAKQIALIEAGKQEYLSHGNLESIRNYTDVRDTVKAYIAAIDLRSDVYNVCSEQNLSMQEILDELSKLAKVEIITKQDPSRMRPSDFSFAKPSAAKLQELTEWKAEIPIKKTLNEILNYWRQRVNS